MAEGQILALAERARSLGDEARDRDDAEHERGEIAFALVAARHLARREQRVDAAGADLVRPREHADGADGLGGAGRGVAERLEESHVRPVQVAHEVDDGIRRGRRLLGREESRGSRRRVLRERGDARCVDDDHGLEAAERPADVDPLDILGLHLAEIDREPSPLPAHRHPSRFAVARMHRDGRRRGVAVPRDHPRALRRVGRGDLLAEHGVQQRGLPRLHHARDREPQRLAQPLLEPGDHRLGFGIAVVDLGSGAQQALRVVPRGGRHRRTGSGGEPARGAGRSSAGSAGSAGIPLRRVSSCSSWRFS